MNLYELLLDMLSAVLVAVGVWLFVVVAFSFGG